ncbi:hypothetical protein MKEN_00521500 [Mycena kentingensis (nom. inval.)]|nr:hypothetical protein MKEN_00521500 [Mycena kentingensis (nom. inval.)]
MNSETPNTNNRFATHGLLEALMEPATRPTNGRARAPRRAGPRRSHGNDFTLHIDTHNLPPPPTRVERGRQPLRAIKENIPPSQNNPVPTRAAPRAPSRIPVRTNQLPARRERLHRYSPYRRTPPSIEIPVLPQGPIRGVYWAAESLIAVRLSTMMAGLNIEAEEDGDRTPVPRA